MNRLTAFLFALFLLSLLSSTSFGGNANSVVISYYPTANTMPANVASFNGVNGNANPISIITTGTNGLPLMSASRSVFAWVYPSAAEGGYSTIYSYGVDQTDNAFALFDNSGTFALGIYGATTSSGTSLSQNKWTFVGVTYSSGIVTFYVNNLAPTIGDMSSVYTSLGSTQNSLIGAEVQLYINRYFTGSVADLQVYNSVLTTAQANALYAEGIGGSPVAGQTGNIVLWMPLNSINPNSNAKDYSPNGNTGTAQNVIYPGNYVGGYTPPANSFSIQSGNTLVLQGGTNDTKPNYQYVYEISSYPSNTYISTACTDTSISTPFDTCSWTIPSSLNGDNVQANVIVTDGSSVVSNSIYSGVITVVASSVTTNQLIATNNPYTLSNTIIDVGQYALANTVISNGISTVTAYTGNWAWTAPNGNVLTLSNTPSVTLGTNNALTFLANPVAYNSLLITIGGTTYTVNSIGTNNIYGTWTFNGYATDANGDTNPTPRLTNTIVINAALVAGTPTATNTIIDNGQWTSLNTAASGGTTSYSYQWYYGSSSSCATDVSQNSGPATSNYLINPSSSTYYCYKVTDSATTNNVMYSGTIQIVVYTALSGAITLSPASTQTIDNGQSVVFTSTNTIANGAPTLHGQWYSSASSTCNTGSTVIGGQTGTGTTVTPSSTTYYCLAVSDGATTNEIVLSGATEVVVDTALTSNVPSIASSNTIVDTGQYFTLKTTWAGGVPNFAVEFWNITGAKAQSNTAGIAASPSTNTLQAGAAATDSYNAIVSDSSSSGAQTTNSVPITITIHNAMSALSTGAGATIDSGQSNTITATWSGGSANYAVTLFNGLTAGACTTPVSTTSGVSGLSTTFSVSPTVNTYYCIGISDSASTNAIANQITPSKITVNTAQTANILLESNTIMDLGQSTTLTAGATGGTPSYTFNWFSGASCGGTSFGSGTTISNTPTGAGTITFSFNSVDSATVNNAICSASNSITVYADPTTQLSFTNAGGNAITTSQTAIANDIASSGSGSFSWQWTINNVGVTNAVVSATQSSNTYATPAAGTYVYNVIATDTGTTTHYVVAQETNTLVVTAGYTPPTVNQPTISNSVVDVGQTETITATITAGTPNYVGNAIILANEIIAVPSQGGTALSESWIVAANEIGTETGNYVLTDAHPTAFNSVPSASFTVHAAMASLSTGSSISIDTGNSNTITASWQYGTPNYAVTLFAETSPTCGTGVTSTTTQTNIGGTSTTFTVSPTATMYYCIGISDSATTNDIANQITASKITVNPQITITGAQATSPIDLGQYSQLSASASGGTGTYTTEQWYYTTTNSNSTGTAVSAGGGLTVSNTPTQTGAAYYYLIVSDGNSTTKATTPIITVDVNPAMSPTITPSTPNIDNLQSILLTANSNGGSGGNTYQWFNNVGCSGIVQATTQTYLVAPSVSTTYCVKITDTNANVPITLSATDEVYVNPTLASTWVATSNPIATGSTQTLTAGTGSTGTSQWSYNVLVYNALGTLEYNSLSPFTASATNVVSFTQSAGWGTGVFTANVYITDQAYSACTIGNTLTYTVNPAYVSPTISQPTISNSIVDVGQTENIQAIITGGTANYIGNAIILANEIIAVPSQSGTALSSSWVVAANEVGTETGNFIMTDSQPTVFNSVPSAPFYIYSQLIAGAITPSSPTINYGQNSLLTSHASGGTGSFSYQWYSSAGCSNPIGGATSATYNAVPTVTTTYYYAVTDTGTSSPWAVCSAGDTVTVNGGLPTCGTSPTLFAPNPGSSYLNPSNSAISWQFAITANQFSSLQLLVNGTSVFPTNIPSGAVASWTVPANTAVVFNPSNTANTPIVYVQCVAASGSGALLNLPFPSTSFPLSEVLMALGFILLLVRFISKTNGYRWVIVDVLVIFFVLFGFFYTIFPTSSSGTITGNIGASAFTANTSVASQSVAIGSTGFIILGLLVLVMIIIGVLFMLRDFIKAQETNEW